MKKLIPILLLIPLGCSRCGFRHELREAIKNYQEVNDTLCAEIFVGQDTAVVMHELLNPNYEALEVHGAIKVFMNNDEYEIPTIVCPSELVYDVHFTTNKGNLQISYGYTPFKPNRIPQGADICVYLPHNPALRTVDLDGAAYFSAILSPRQVFDLDLDGASEASIVIDCERLDIDMDGASKALFAGTATQLTVDLDGASRLTAYDLKAQQAEVDMDGACKASLNVKQRISGELDGACTPQTFNCNPTLALEKSRACTIEQLNRDHE